MNRARKVLQSLGSVAVAASAIFIGGTIAASCIVHDTGIVVNEKGYSWCTRAVGASAWTDPTIPIAVTGTDNEPVKGCICVDNEKDNTLFEKWVSVPGGPPDTDPDFADFDLLRDKILLAAREACEDRAGDLGQFNDCQDVLTDDNLLFDDGRSDDCRIEALYADTDTDSDGEPIDPNPFDLSGVTCSSGVCSAPQSLIDDMMARPSAFAHDSTRVEIRADGLYFTSVEPRDAAYLLGIRTGDKLLTINGASVTDVGDVADALVDLADSSRAQATFKDKYGATVTITLRVR